MRKGTLIVLVLCMAMLTIGCGSTPAPSDQKQQEQPQKEENTAVETTLGAGEWYVGEDIQPGRYVITSPKIGNITLYEADKDYPSKTEIIDPTGKNGVKSLTWDFSAGQKIEISNMEDVLFTPKED